MMRIYHKDWKRVTERMELLLADPQEFCIQHGYMYGVKPEKKGTEQGSHAEPEKKEKEPAVFAIMRGILSLVLPPLLYFVALSLWCALWTE